LQKRGSHPTGKVLEIALVEWRRRAQDPDILLSLLHHHRSGVRELARKLAKRPDAGIASK